MRLRGGDGERGESNDAEPQQGTANPAGVPREQARHQLRVGEARDACVAASLEKIESTRDDGDNGNRRRQPNRYGIREFHYGMGSAHLRRVAADAAINTPPSTAKGIKPSSYS